MENIPTNRKSSKEDTSSGKKKIKLCLTTQPPDTNTGIKLPVTIGKLLL